MQSAVKVLMVRWIFLPLGLLLLVGAVISVGAINSRIETQTGKTIGTVYKCDFPLFKDSGFHNNIEFVTVDGGKCQFYESTLELLSVNSKVPVRYAPRAPKGNCQIDNWVEIYEITIFIALIGVVFVACGSSTFVKEPQKATVE